MEMGIFVKNNEPWPEKRYREEMVYTANLPRPFGPANTNGDGRSNRAAKQALRLDVMAAQDEGSPPTQYGLFLHQCFGRVLVFMYQKRL